MSGFFSKFSRKNKKNETLSVEEQIALAKANKSDSWTEHEISDELTSTQQNPLLKGAVTGSDTESAPVVEESVLEEPVVEASLEESVVEKLLDGESIAKESLADSELTQAAGDTVRVETLDIQSIDPADIADASNLSELSKEKPIDPLDELSKQIDEEIAVEKLRKAQELKEELIKEATAELRAPNFKDEPKK